MFLCKDRNEAVASYRKWITEGEGKHLMKDLHQLKGKKIACWCKPQSCHGDILAELAEEQESYKDFQIIRKLDNTMVQRNYLQIKKDIQDIIQSEMERLLNDPGLSHLVVKK